MPQRLVALARCRSTGRAPTIASRSLRLDLVCFDPPIPLSGFEPVQLWHERTAASAPHVWLRGELDRAAPRPSKARKRGA